MKAIYGRLYVTEKDVQQFRIPYTAGVIKILHGILNVNDLPEPMPLPDICVSCGTYAGEGGQLCPNCKKEAER